MNKLKPNRGTGFPVVKKSISLFSSLFSLKNLLIMKLIIIVLIATGIQVAAKSTDAQDLTISGKNISLDKVFREITRQTDYQFFYKNESLRSAKPVDINARDASVSQVLKECFKNQPLTYALVGNTIVVKKKPAPAVIFAPETKLPNPIKGTVRDSSSGNPLVGVTIREVGGTIGTTTDNKGEFAIPDIQQDAILEISYLGYSSKQIHLNGKTSFNILLASSATGLNQLVVVGYGTQKKKDLTGSVATISDKAMKDLSVSNVGQSLAGKISGVQVQSISGEPGAAPQIRIRGISSISAGAAPLYVVDGYPTDDIDMLDVDNIASIDILKDASATAIYGSRGSNGVVIINTKRGFSGKTTLTLDTYIGWQKILKKPKFLSVTDQTQYYYDGVKNQNIDGGYDVSGDPASWFYSVPATILDVLSGKNTTNVDALDSVLRVAPQQRYQLTARGGSDKIKYFISGGYLNQDGIVINTNFRRYSIRTNLDAQISDRLSIRLNLSTAYMTNNYIQAEGGSGGGVGIIGNAMAWVPYYPLHNPDGSYFVMSGIDASNIEWNPLAIANEIKSRSQRLRVLGNISTQYKIYKDLMLNVQIGATTSNSHSYEFIPNIPAFYSPADGSDNTSSYLNWLTETTLNYNKTIKGKHHITGLVGYTTQQESSRENSLESHSFPNNLVYTLNAASNLISQGSSSEAQWALISYLARVNYNYNEKYYLTASIRSDGSSRFGKEKKYGTFPSLALAWRISNENFLKNVSFINEIKIRSSYGETGNNNIGNYAQFATVSYNSYPFGGVTTGGYAPSQLANPILTWEKQQSFNTGIDASVLDDRIALTADYYRTKNYNLLLNVNVPLTTGFSTALQNIGEVRNTGWEFTLSTKNLVNAFSWSTDFNISTSRNKVTKLGPEGAPIINDHNITQIGSPIGMFYGYIADGIYKSQKELDAGPIYDPGAADHSRVGDIRFKDISGPDGKPDGTVNSYDRAVMGSPYPDFYYGITNQFGYKNLGLTVVVQGSKGGKTFDANDHFLYTRARYRQLSTQKDYWKSEDDPGDGQAPRPNNNPTGGLRQLSSRFLNPASFLRINDISLSYLLPKGVSDQLKITSLRFYMTATNPLIITKNKLYNPEVNDSSNPLTPGLDNNDYPLEKSLIIGLNISF